MRLARKLMLLAMMAIAATALAAPSAFAQGSETEPLTLAPAGLQVRAETAGTLCPAVTPNPPPASGNFNAAGGCVVHGGGAGIVLSGHLFGIESIDSTCTVEFDLRIASNATGFLTHQEFTQGPTGTCTRRACNTTLPPPPAEEPPVTGQGEGRPWRGYAREIGEPPTATEAITVLFCVEDRHTTTARQNARHCNVTVPFVETTNHRYTFTANDINASGTPRCELNGVFTTEATQVSPGGEGQARTHVEVNHL